MEETTGAPSSFAALSPRRLRASSRDGGGVVNRPPSPLTMLLSRHTRRREVIAVLADRCAVRADLGRIGYAVAASGAEVDRAHRTFWPTQRAEPQRALARIGILCYVGPASRGVEGQNFTSNTRCADGQWIVCRASRPSSCRQRRRHDRDRTSHVGGEALDYDSTDHSRVQRRSCAQRRGIEPRATRRQHHRVLVHVDRAGGEAP